MGTLKEKLKKATEFYNNINTICDNKDEKKIIIERYSTPAAKKDPFISSLMKNEDNFEIYHLKYSNLYTPPVIIAKHDILSKYNQSDGALHYFTDIKCDKMIAPIIIISSRLFDCGNSPLIEYVIHHEIGHFRLNHIEEKRNILNEVEADMYACDSIGIEMFMSGMTSLITYLRENDKPSNNIINELFDRLEFIAKRNGVKF